MAHCVLSDLAEPTLTTRYVIEPPTYEGIGDVLRNAGDHLSPRQPWQATFRLPYVVERAYECDPMAARLSMMPSFEPTSPPSSTLRSSRLLWIIA